MSVISVAWFAQIVFEMDENRRISKAGAEPQSAEPQSAEPQNAEPQSASIDAIKRSSRPGHKQLIDSNSATARNRSYSRT
jgi:hypothetical protein